MDDDRHRLRRHQDSVGGLPDPHPVRARPAGRHDALFGVTRSIDAVVFADRYPEGRAGYVREFDDATRAAVGAGFLLDVDAPEIRGLARSTWPR